MHESLEYLLRLNEKLRVIQEKHKFHRLSILMRDSTLEFLEYSLRNSHNFNLHFSLLSFWIPSFENILKFFDRVLDFKERRRNFQKPYISLELSFTSNGYSLRICPLTITSIRRLQCIASLLLPSVNIQLKCLFVTLRCSE